MQNLRILPKLRDSLSYLYLEHAILDQKDTAVEYIDQTGKVLIPVASLCLLMLGPGTSITHAAIKTLTENGCNILWTGEEGTRFYAQGTGETRKGYHLMHQAKMASDPHLHMDVVIRMYSHRFAVELDHKLSLPQLRGLEGVRVREAYARAAQSFGVNWSGRKYDRENWNKSDPINRALSAGNALLNGLCHAAIVSGGYSPGLGFIHSGKQLSFVYDIADLYKTEFTIPTAFEVVAGQSHRIEAAVREKLREKFRVGKLLERILPDIDQLLSVPDNFLLEFPADEDQALPEPYWKEDVEV